MKFRRAAWWVGGGLLALIGVVVLPGVPLVETDAWGEHETGIRRSLQAISRRGA